MASTEEKQSHTIPLLIFDFTIICSKKSQRLGGRVVQTAIMCVNNFRKHRNNIPAPEIELLRFGYVSFIKSGKKYIGIHLIAFDKDTDQKLHNNSTPSYWNISSVFSTI